VKLARHFVSDVPPRPAVATASRRALRDSRGDLAAAAAAVIACPEAWAAPLHKLRSGQDYAIAVLRALGRARRARPCCSAR
jgi:uncharacterized protein (DUF1800 family)